MTTSWTRGGVELFDIVDAASNDGTFVFERADGQTLVLIASGDDNTGDVFLRQHVRTTTPTDFHIVVIGERATGVGHPRLRIASHGTMCSDETLPFDDIRQRLIHWWRGDDLCQQE